MNCLHCGKKIETLIDDDEVRKIRQRKYVSADFTELKRYFLETWKLRHGEYPFTVIDAGILGRLLSYELAKAKAILDCGKEMILNDEWTYKNIGMNLRALEHIKAKILDSEKLSKYIKKYELKFDKDAPSQEFQKMD